MEGTFGPAVAVVAALVAILLIGGWRGRYQFARLLSALQKDPRARDRFYRRSIISSWVMGLSVPLVLVLSPGLTPADIGLRWPAGDGLDYALTAFLLLAIVLGGLRRRRRNIQIGRMQALFPRTAAQRRLAAGVSVSAGVVEEAVFRGLLIAAGAGILGVPVEVAAVLSLALFVWGHLYQGRAGLVGVTILGAMFTSLYLISGSILLPAIVHTAQDLVALLLVPSGAQPSAPPRALSQDPPLDPQPAATDAIPQQTSTGTIPQPAITDAIPRQTAAAPADTPAPAARIRPAAPGQP